MWEIIFKDSFMFLLWYQDLTLNADQGIHEVHRLFHMDSSAEDGKMLQLKTKTIHTPQRNSSP